MTIVLQIFPNGEFTHGVDTSHRRDRNRPPQISAPPELIPVGDSVSLRSGDCRDEFFPEAIAAEPGDEFLNVHGDTYTYLCADMNKHIYAFESADGTFVSVTNLSDKLINYIKRGELTPLGLSTARNLKKMPERRRTTKRMTKSMARNIRNAGHILQEKFGKDNLSFLTLTLPDLCEEDLYEVSINWGAMVHKFLVWLRYRCELSGMPFRYVYCTEIQSKRLQRRNEYAPHLHLLFGGRSGKGRPWIITPKMARKQWVRCLRSVLNHTKFNQSALENLQRVKFNAAGYISKYMSKGGCCLPAGDSEPILAQLSTDWGGMDRTTRQQITASTLIIRGDGKRWHDAWIFIRNIQYLIRQGFVAFYKAGFIVLSNTPDNQSPRGLKVGVGRFAIPVDNDAFNEIIRFIVNNCDEGLDNSGVN